jgi:hypothetical protein
MHVTTLVACAIEADLERKLRLAASRRAAQREPDRLTARLRAIQTAARRMCRRPAAVPGGART